MKSVLVSLKKTMVGALAFVMAASLAVPAPAMAAATKDETQTETTQQEDAPGKTETSGQTDAAEPITAEIKVTNYTKDRNDAETVSGLVISDIEAPVTGKALDQKAQVTTAENKKWEVPVLWINSKEEIAMGNAKKDVTYLPVVAYVVPSEYKIQNTDESANTYTITFSEEVTKLFGGTRIITLYEQTSGITYILPESVKKFLPLREEEHPHAYTGSEEEVYTPADSDDDETNTSTDSSAPVEGGEAKPQEEQKEEPAKESTADSALKKLVDIHCTKAAKDLFSEEDLEFFVDLVINKLQPQAVNLLIESFPCFAEAAKNGEIGKNIGLEIDHSSTSTAVGMAMPGAFGDEYKFAYKVWINTYPISEDLDTSSPSILREGDEIVDLGNTLVHEFLHIFMNDYTRTGMSGTTSPSEAFYEADGKTPTAKAQATLFPQWFIEGTASAVEHNWRNRSDAFKLLRMNEQNEYLDNYEAQTFVYRYVKGVAATSEENAYNFDIECSSSVDKNGNEVNTLGNRYVTGYLATLYLCDMAAQHDPDLGSSIQKTDNGVKIYAGNLKDGMNTILTRLHEGETLDAIVKDISDGRYTSADDYGAKYIKGTLTDGYYYGDKPSLEFTLTLMNYLKDIDSDKSRENPVNGSILFEFFGDFDSPLELNPTEEVTTDFYKILDTTDYVYSTVSEERAYATGGKSISGVPANTDASDTDASSATGGDTSGNTGDDASGAATGDASSTAGDDASGTVAGDASGNTAGAAAKEEMPSNDAEAEVDHAETADAVVSDEDIVEAETADAEASDEEAADEDTSDVEAVVETSSDEENVAEDASDEAPASEDASNEEAMTEEAYSDESADEEVSE